MKVASSDAVHLQVTGFCKFGVSYGVPDSLRIDMLPTLSFCTSRLCCLHCHSKVSILGN